VAVRVASLITDGLACLIRFWPAKWRPGTFSEMVGQQHVLAGAGERAGVGPSTPCLLFTGTRGVGKTTVARILAKCLNCDTGVTATPCGECGACAEIAEGRSVDLIEVDAASKTKVEDTRELLENVQYTPTRARYKIYLIDEVHMLSNHSFNALVENPGRAAAPRHVSAGDHGSAKAAGDGVVAMFAVQPKNMQPEQIVAHLEHILAAESIKADPKRWR
jgi:DNA polymerase-3 subunit gamma/tau